jgi:hypothetical protein
MKLADSLGISQILPLDVDRSALQHAWPTRWRQGGGRVAGVPARATLSPRRLKQHRSTRSSAARCPT